MPNTISLLRRFLPAIAIFGAAIGWNSPSDAYVQKIVIDQQISLSFTPLVLGTSTPGASTPYTIYTGRIFGELDPSDPQHAIITDIEHAPRTQGKVAYVANFQIITPTDPHQRSGLLIHEVPNRGNNAISTAALIQGATYVQSGWQGDLLAQCSPATATPYPCFNLNSGPFGSLNTTTGALVPPGVPDVAAGTKTLASYVVQVPVATFGNSSNNGYGPRDPGDDDHAAGGNIITGQVYGHVCSGTNGCGLPVPAGTPPSTAQLAIQGPAFVPYHPASLDTKQAQFWSVSSQTAAGVTSVKTPIPSSQWAWAYCPNGWPGTPNPNWICLKNGTFNPKLEYEMVYTAENPLVLGVGFAAFRDLAAFLRYGSVAPGGGSNPIAGSITTAMTIGASQSAAFIHGFIFWGFNEEGHDQWGHDQRGRIVFDGAWPQIDGRMMVMNIRFGQPNNLMYLYMGGDEAPVWWGDYPNLARHLPPDGMLHRCARDNTCPAILETFASAELYSEKMAVSLCGFTCVQDIPIPSNVFRYYTPGATHGGGAVSPTLNLFNWISPAAVSVPVGQSLANNPVPEAYTNNALQYNFIRLLMDGVAMPRSAYPTVSSGQLVPNTQHGVGFPDIPGLPYQGEQAWPPFVYNYGPRENYDQETGVPTIQPPIIERVLQVYTAKVNADGNEAVAGLPTILGEAPLGTYTGWNLATTGWYGPNASNGPGSVGQVFAGAGNSGGYYPFWDTKANRQANGDPRPSLEERYGTHAGYVCVVTRAVNTAEQQRFLLASDAQTLISQVSASNVLAAVTATSADTALANSLCAN
jgi:Alpha/beta hydrolase domain